MDCKYPVRAASTAYRRGCRCERCVTHHRLSRFSRGYYPRPRVAAMLQHWFNQTGSGIGHLAHLTGVQERVLYRILYGPSPSELAKNRATGENVAFDTVDRILCGIGWLHLFHLGPEDGGFADLYEYDTDLERAAA